MEIGVWGDSITYGQNDSEGLGWVGRLRNSFPIDEYVGVYNRGVCGDTSTDLLKRFPIEADSIEPNRILFAIGINDAKFPEVRDKNNVSLEQFKKNMLELIKVAREFTNDISIISTTQVEESALNSKSTFLNTEIMKYNSTLKEIANTENLKFIDVHDALLPENLYDGLHPNAAGYAKLAEIITSNIRSS